MPCTQEKTELANLVRAVRSTQPKRVLEIGGFLGGTTYVWANYLRPDVLHVIEDFVGLASIPDEAFPLVGYETRPDKYEVMDKWHKWGTEFNVELQAHPIDSHTGFDLFKECNPEPYDFLFIDGDHTYEGAKQDFDNYKTLVRPGGLIALHDIINFSGVPENNVQPLWEEIKKEYPYQEFVSRPGQEWMGIGLVAV